MRVRVAVTLLSAIIATTASAQTGAPLPESLSGRWMFVFEGNRAPGIVPARLTWRGFSCGAMDEPIQATWDGAELKFEAVLKANTNTQRMNGDCPADPTRWVLKRKTGEGSFEGEGRVGNIVVTVTTSP
jgi:hypothetical protein